jgi:hypothetical protein
MKLDQSIAQPWLAIGGLQIFFVQLHRFRVIADFCSRYNGPEAGTDTTWRRVAEVT